MHMQETNLLISSQLKELKESQTKGEPDMETSVKELSIKEQQIMEKLCQNRMSKIKVNFLAIKPWFLKPHVEELSK